MTPRFRTTFRPALLELEARAVPSVASAPASADPVPAGQSPQVAVRDADGAVVATIAAYEPGMTGGVRVAVADLTGDGVLDIVTAPGVGGGPRVRVFDGATFAPAADFFAYDAAFRGGVSVAAGPLGGGTVGVATGAGAGGAPHVRVFTPAGAVVTEFFAHDPADRGGATVALAVGPGGSAVLTVSGDGWSAAFDPQTGTAAALTPGRDLVTDDNDNGIGDGYEVDADDDGEPDLADTDGDGEPDALVIDLDGDGVPDTFALDVDGDGDFDAIVLTPAPGERGLQVDLDGDGHPDGYGLDRDRDGEVDAIELDRNEDGEPDPIDWDGDGVPDGIGIDLDGDGEADAVGYDLDGDGVTDVVGIDTDGDGTIDSFDTNGDGNPDAFGIDGDGDGHIDDVDTNGDGIGDGVDTDGDGNIDGVDIDKDGDIDDISGGNHAPIAVTDQADTLPGQVVAVAVLGNDSDPDGDAISVTAQSQPSNGSVAIDSSGRLVYTPAPGYAGVDSFTYTIGDGHGLTATATVYVTVALAPAAPKVHVIWVEGTTPPAFGLLGGNYLETQVIDKLKTAFQTKNVVFDGFQTVATAIPLAANHLPAFHPVAAGRKLIEAVDVIHKASPADKYVIVGYSFGARAVMNALREAYLTPPSGLLQRQSKRKPETLFEAVYTVDPIIESPLLKLADQNLHVQYSNDKTNPNRIGVTQLVHDRIASGWFSRFSRH